MRQRGDFLGNAMLREYARDVRLPGRRTDQSLTKSIRLSELKAYPVDRGEEVRGGGACAEGMQNPPLVCREALFVACGEAPEQRRIAGLGFRYAPLTLCWRGCQVETQDFVDQPEIAVIVEQPLVGRDLGIDADPEAHIRLEFGRMSERIGPFGGVRATIKDRREQQAQRRELE